MRFFLHKNAYIFDVFNEKIKWQKLTLYSDKCKLRKHMFMYRLKL